MFFINLKIQTKLKIFTTLILTSFFSILTIQTTSGNSNADNENEFKRDPYPVKYDQDFMEQYSEQLFGELRAYNYSEEDIDYTVRILNEMLEMTADSKLEKHFIELHARARDTLDPKLYEELQKKYMIAVDQLPIGSARKENIHAWYQHAMSGGGKPFVFEMGQFYAASLALELKKCIEKKDSSGCMLFMDDMKSIHGHIGFWLFSEGAHLSGTVINGLNEAIKRSAGGALVIPGALIGPLTMATGHYVSSIYGELAQDPRFKEIFSTFASDKLGRSEKWKKIGELRKELMKDMFASRYWWADQTAAVTSLIASSVGTGVLGSFVGGIFARVQQLGLTSFLSRVALDPFGNKLVGLLPVIQNISHTTTFLGISEVLEHLFGSELKLYFNDVNVANDLSQLKRELNRPVGGDDGLKRFEGQAKDLVKGFNHGRIQRIMESYIDFIGYITSLDQSAAQMTKIQNYYYWFLLGMSDKNWQKRPSFHKWHSEGEKEKEDFLEAAFCGPEIRDSIKVYTEKNGIPIPFIKKEVSTSRYNDIRAIDVVPYRLFKVEGTCFNEIRGDFNWSAESTKSEKDLVSCPISEDVQAETFKLEPNRVTFGLCKKTVRRYRESIFKRLKLASTSKDKKRTITQNDLQEKIGQRILAHADYYRSVQDLIQRKMEKNMRPLVLSEFSGKKVTIDKAGIAHYEDRNLWESFKDGKLGSASHGLIEDIELEKSTWLELIQDVRSEQKRKILKEIGLKSAEDQLAVAKHVLAYFEAPTYEQRFFYRDQDSISQFAQSHNSDQAMQYLQFIVPTQSEYMSVDFSE